MDIQRDSNEALPPDSELGMRNAIDFPDLIWRTAQKKCVGRAISLRKVGVDDDEELKTGPAQTAKQELLIEGDAAHSRVNFSNRYHAPCRLSDGCCRAQQESIEASNNECSENPIEAIETR